MFRVFRPALKRAVLVLPLLFPLLVAANEVDEVQKLMQKGAYKEALAQTDLALANQPRDANLRFLKGVLLAQLDRKPEATAVFTALTQDYPQLGEPYNNLGVLLAGAGELDRAREVLQRAVQVAPGYATAHENLGDLYARLSAQSYEKAAQLDGNNAKARNKLSMARELSNAAASSSAAHGNTARAAPAMAANEAGQAAARSPARQTIVVNGSAPLPAAAGKGKPVSAAPAATAPAAAAPNSAATGSAAADKAAAPAGPEEQAVLAAVQRWSQAWSARDLKQYLASYAGDFRPASGASMAAWRAEREKRINGKSEIQVQVLQPRVKLDGKHATVKFIQVYQSGKLSERDMKELVLVQHGPDWLIQQEKVNGKAPG